MLISLFFFSSRRRHTRLTCDWSSDVCSSDLSDLAPPRFVSRTLSGRTSHPLGSELVPPRVGTLPPSGLPCDPLGSAARLPHRSEERRVGKECRSRWSRYN